MSEANLKTILKEASGDVLTDDTLDQIETMFNEAVDTKAAIRVEKALIEQDESHAGKLGELLEAIDDDHSDKLQKVVGAIDQNHSQKLVQLVKRYEGTLNEEAGSFKDSLVENISTYIDEYIDEKLPITEIEAAVKNKKALAVLESLRSTLGVDFALAKETIRDAIQEGKETITESHTQISQLQEQNNNLASKVDTLSTHILLTEKTQDLPAQKKNYVFKVLSDKDTQFINENFDYTVRLFDKTEQEKIEQIKDEAISQRAPEVDRPIVERAETQTAPEEATNTPSSPFAADIMSELGKF
jgi:hypothetical protein